MRCFAGLDVSTETTTICIVDPDGTVVRESKVISDPKAISRDLKAAKVRFTRVGMEASNTAMWLYAGLAKAGLPIVCIEARHAHGLLKAKRNKTDRNDARGIADLVRAGLYRKVHVKSDASRHSRGLLTARRLLLVKLVDLENAIGGMLRGGGLKLQSNARPGYADRVRSLLARAPRCADYIHPLLAAHEVIASQFHAIDARVNATAREDPVCARMMTVPGVGPIAALTFRSTIDAPERFSHSRTVAAHLGLTSRGRQSGKMDWRGRITKWGDRACRTALVAAGRALLHPRTGLSPLKRWGLAIAQRRSFMKAAVALARRLAVLLHRIWIDGSTYRADLAAA